MHFLTAPTLDGLFLQGAGIILRDGRDINSRAGEALQVTNVGYDLADSRNRIFWLRHPTSTKYMCREFLAYFRGSLHVEDGLSHASKAWRKLADANCQISSNYGHYVFHDRWHGKSQYEWVVEMLTANIDSRRALININQIRHKDAAARDFPCNIAIHFFVEAEKVFCQAYSRSEDVLIGLPYDMAFFSFLNELVAADLRQRLDRPLASGSTDILCTFSQIYKSDRRLVEALIRKFLVKTIDRKAQPKPSEFPSMPEISDAQAVLADIYNKTRRTTVLQWIEEYAD
jgi:thymidylate synthase